ncbi:MAG: hypothetical protein HY327_11760 [Chloroflexi bacterium]|nr:hypothetical protein [Chloroflexota bacterium]
MVDHPRYAYPIRLLLIPALRVLLGIQSSISRDAALLLRGARPAPRILNAGHVPPASPFICVFNHYDRAGLGAWWSGALIAHAIAQQRAREPRDAHFLMTSHWWYPGGWEKTLKQPATRWLFGRLAKAYGIVLLPPVIDEYRGTAAPALKRAIALTRGENPQLIALAPEGMTGAGQALREPPQGAGLFLQLLSHDAIDFLPAGIYEASDALTLQFGAPFRLNVPRGFARNAKDREIARKVMVEIGKCLPERMRGVYGNERLRD